MTKETTGQAARSGCEICEKNPVFAKHLCRPCYNRLYHARAKARALDPATKRAIATHAARLLMSQGRVKVRLIGEGRPKLKTARRVPAQSGGRKEKE